MKKKLLSIALTFAMLLSTVSALTTVGYAADGSNEVLSISTYADLENFIASLATFDYAGKTVTLTGDITGNETFDALSANTPTASKKLNGSIGTFKGTLDGNGKTLKNLYIKGNSLLGTVDGATVKDLTLENCYLTTEIDNEREYTFGGFLASYASGTSTVEAVTLKGCKAYDNWDALGGLVGGVNTSAVLTLNSCINSEGELQLTDNNEQALLGGFVGKVGDLTTLNINDCQNLSRLSSMNTSKPGGTKVGGMVSLIAAKAIVNINRCANRGSLEALCMAGGLVADNRGTLTVTDCLNEGAVTAGITVQDTDNVTKDEAKQGTNHYAGGLVGQTYDTQSSVTVSGSANMGKITSFNRKNENEFAAGAICIVDKSTVTVRDFLNMGEVKGYHAAGGVIGKYYRSTNGVFERIITFGKIAGYGGNTDNETVTDDGVIQIDHFTTGKLIGAWLLDPNNPTASRVTVNDLYFNYAEIISHSSDDKSEKDLEITNIFGMYDELGTANKSYTAHYTKDDVKKDFVGGTDNQGQITGISSPQANLRHYNAFFHESGRIWRPSDVYSTAAVAKFTAYGIGDTWRLTSTVLMPTGAQRLLEAVPDTNGKIRYRGCQTSIGTEATNIRFIADVLADITEYRAIGFEIKCAEQGYGIATSPGKTESDVVYTTLNIHNEKAELVGTIDAQDGKYLTALTVNNIPKEGTYTFVIKPYLVYIGNGEPVDAVGEIGAAYAVVVKNGVATYSYTYQNGYTSK